MLDRPLRMLVAAMGASLVLEAAPQAFADDAKPIPQPVAVDLDRLSAELDFFAAEERREHWVGALTGLGVGSIMLPTGFVLLQRADSPSKALAIGLMIGGGAQLLSVSAVFLRTRMDGVRDDFRQRWLFRDANPEATLRIVEAEWRDAAVTAHNLRTLGGIAGLTAGALSLLAGVVILLGPSGMLGMDRTAQYTWGGTLLGSGASVGTLGIQAVIQESAVERSWNTYQLMVAPRVLPPVSLRVAPVRGGGMGVVAISF
jgi:hypothetical protein